MKLSIIISNRNDIVLLSVTLNSILEALKSVKHKCEVIVVDNSEKYFWNLLEIAFPAFRRHSGVKFFRYEKPCFTKARMIAAEKARGEYLFCVDSHVLIGNGTLERSIEFMDSHPNIGFGHPPMRWAKDGPNMLRQAIVAAPGQTFYKMWNSRRITKDQKIFWSFMPWICNREWYLNTLRGYGSHAEHHVSWGGAEMLQQIKSWILGYPNWYIRSNPVIHIGPYHSSLYKAGVEKRKPYKNSGEFPVGFGVILAMYILGGERLGYKYAKMAGQRIRKMHKIKVDNWWDKAMELGKVEHEWLMENKKYSLRELLKNQPWND